MSDQDQDKNTEQVDIAGEFERLGKNIQQVFTTAVQSDEWKRIRGEVQQGISDLGDTLSHFAKEFSDSPTGQKVKTGLDDFQAQARKAEIEGRVRDEVLNALRHANAGLEKAAIKMKEESGKQAEAEKGSTEGADPESSPPAE